jgi:hypothetical protein
MTRRMLVQAAMTVLALERTRSPRHEFLPRRRELSNASRSRVQECCHVAENGQTLNIKAVYRKH